MKITNSLIFIPENSMNVKKQMMLGNKHGFNPLLRNMNLKNRPKYQQQNQQRTSALVAHDVVESRVSPKKKISSGRVWIKNATGGPILINIPNGHDDHGYPLYKEIRIPDFIRKDKLSIQDLESYEISVLYDAGKIVDIPEEQFHQEVEDNKRKNEQKRSKTKMRKDFHDLETVRNQEDNQYVEVNGKQIKITEDLYAGHGRSTEDFDVEEGTRLSRETESLMSGSGFMDDGIDDLIPGGRSYTSRRPAAQPRQPRNDASAYTRPVSMPDPDKAIRSNHR